MISTFYNFKYKNVHHLLKQEMKNPSVLEPDGDTDPDVSVWLLYLDHLCLGDGRWPCGSSRRCGRKPRPSGWRGSRGQDGLGEAAAMVSKQ